MTTNTVVFSYLLHCYHFHFHFLTVFSLLKAAEQFLLQNRGLCYAMLLKRLSILFDTLDILKT
jgi:hypothetical protein